MGKLTPGGSGRQRVIQEPPPPGIDLSAFPTDPLPSSTPLYRAHTAGNGPWYFGSTMKGRFDLASPRGTCYAAESIGAAMRERLGEQFAGGGQISGELADSAAVTEIKPTPGRGANPEAGGHADYATGATISGREACKSAGIRVLPPSPWDASLLRVVAPPKQ